MGMQILHGGEGVGGDRGGGRGVIKGVGGEEVGVRWWGVRWWGGDGSAISGGNQGRGCGGGKGGGRRGIMMRIALCLCTYLLI